MIGRRILVNILIVILAVATWGSGKGQPDPAGGQSPPKTTPGFPVADVVLEPARRWKTSRQEFLRLKERLKKFIRREIDKVDADIQARHYAKAKPHGVTMMQMNSFGQSSNPFASAQASAMSGKLNFLHHQDAKPRFMQQQSSLRLTPQGPTYSPTVAFSAGMPGQFMMPSGGVQPTTSQLLPSATPEFEYNEAGAMMDALQPRAAAELARVITEVGLKPQEREETEYLLKRLQGLVNSDPSANEIDSNSSTPAIKEFNEIGSDPSTHEAKKSGQAGEQQSKESRKDGEGYAKQQENVTKQNVYDNRKLPNGALDSFFVS